MPSIGCPAKVLEDGRASRGRFHLPCREASASGQLEPGNADELRPARDIWWDPMEEPPRGESPGQFYEFSDGNQVTCFRNVEMIKVQTVQRVQTRSPTEVFPISTLPNPQKMGCHSSKRDVAQLDQKEVPRVGRRGLKVSRVCRTLGELPRVGLFEGYTN